MPRAPKLPREREAGQSALRFTPLGRPLASSAAAPPQSAALVRLPLAPLDNVEVRIPIPQQPAKVPFVCDFAEADAIKAVEEDEEEEALSFGRRLSKKEENALKNVFAEEEAIENRRQLLTKKITKPKGMVSWTGQNTPTLPRKQDRSAPARGPRRLYNAELGARDPFAGGKTFAKSNLQTIIDNPIRSFRLAREYMTADGENWSKLSPGDVLLQDLVRQLEPVRLKLYRILRQQIFVYVDRNIGENAFDRDEPFIWNWSFWHRLVLKIATFTHADYSGDENDCWFTLVNPSKSHGDNSTERVSWNCRYGHVGKRPDSQGSKDWQWYPVPASTDPKRYDVSPARATLALFTRIPTKEDQCSHLCHNVPQLCINPHHTLWETDLANKDRNGCTYGSSSGCPHQPKCIFTNVGGIFLPHRNDVGPPRPCPPDCHLNCHTALTSDKLNSNRGTVQDKLIIPVNIYDEKKETDDDLYDD